MKHYQLLYSFESNFRPHIIGTQMATANLPPPIPSSCLSPRYLLPVPRQSYSRRRSKWTIKLSVVDQNLTPQKNVQQLVGFLYDDLPHFFDEQGIDRTAYDENVKYRDPITKHDTISGYLFNIALLKSIFKPQFFLHWVKQTGAYEITTRWTVVMTFVLLPWRPELVFTGTSVMGINPETGKFCTHLDLWDSIQNNEYFSLEGLWDVLKQLRIYKTPDLGTPTYQILKRTSNYEVRRYEPFVVVEKAAEKLSGSAGFNAVTGLPEPDQGTASLRKVEGGIAAVLKFSGKPTENVVGEKEKALRSSLVEDGLLARSL